MWVLKALVLLLMIYFIGQKINQGHLSANITGFFWLRLREYPYLILLLVAVLLVPVNWGLEAKKWQLLASPLIRLSTFQAARAVLTGLSLGFVTPRSVGDYAGRILESPAAKREGLVGAVLFNRISQSFVTFAAGLAGLFYLFLINGVADVNLWGWFIPVTLAGTFISFFALGRGRYLMKEWGSKYSIVRPFIKYTEITGFYTSGEISRLLFFAFLRYGVFSLQFVLILYLTGVDLPPETLFAGVAVVYTLKSVIPAFSFLSDLGVREFSTMLVFSFFSVPEEPIILAGLLVWCLNILIPAIGGSVNVLRFRLKPPVC